MLAFFEIRDWKDMYAKAQHDFLMKHGLLNEEAKTYNLTANG